MRVISEEKLDGMESFIKEYAHRNNGLRIFASTRILKTDAMMLVERPLWKWASKRKAVVLKGLLKHGSMTVGQMSSGGAPLICRWNPRLRWN